MHLATAGGQLHLSYCLNIHPGESWAENLAAIREQALSVREALGRPGPFGLGLRLSRRAAVELGQPARLAEFRAFLDREGLYVFTVNAFPYGRFHGAAVKERVYAPDWCHAARVDYTVRVADILAQLLPPGVDGSISTVPGSYRAWCTAAAPRRRILDNLGRVACHLARLEERHGRRIRLALEPEPDCLWDTAADMIGLCRDVLPHEGAARLQRLHGLSADRACAVFERHIGVCFDTCHAAVCFEAPATALERLHRAGVAVAKIQVSAAPVARRNGATVRAALARLADPVYLHQTRIRRADGTVLAFPDLAPALEHAARLPADCELRTHCHIPLSVARWGPLGSTRRGLDRRFFALLRRGVSAHLELETYTFSVLPASLRRRGVVDSLASEFRWFLERFAAAD